MSDELILYNPNHTPEIIKEKGLLEYVYDAGKWLGNITGFIPDYSLVTVKPVDEWQIPEIGDNPIPSVFDGIGNAIKETVEGVGETIGNTTNKAIDPLMNKVYTLLLILIAGLIAFYVVGRKVKVI